MTCLIDGEYRSRLKVAVVIGNAALIIECNRSVFCVLNNPEQFNITDEMDIITMDVISRKRITANDETTTIPGLTLRDYFAVKVLPSLLNDFLTVENWEGFDAVAFSAYVIADAMLKARSIDGTSP